MFKRYERTARDGKLVASASWQEGVVKLQAKPWSGDSIELTDEEAEELAEELLVLVRVARGERGA